ncbi:MAG: hypothetical protein AUK63_2230 [bacterium P3]|nr:MAG: hypothetical protein AUK63_2230 [bacterium P3]
MKRAVLTIIVCVMTTLAGMAQGKWSLMPKAGVNIGMLGDEGGKLITGSVLLIIFLDYRVGSLT